MMTRIPHLAAAPAAGTSRAGAAWFAALLALAAVCPAHATNAPVPSASAAPDSPDSPGELIGAPARAWSFERWAVGPPQSLASLRGKVVLMRWFNSDCRFCAHTLPGLEALRTRYEKQGLVVVGVYHPKPIHKVNDADVRRTAAELGFHGAIAVDETWSTLDRWWLDGHPDRNWTSVSFLIDRDGIVRWAQGGGEYHPSSDPRHAHCDAEYTELDRTIRRLLDDRAAAR